MIGRADIVIPRAVEDEGKNSILRVLNAAWPKALLEDAERDDEPIELARFNASALPDEFLVYRDAAALNAWDEDGGTDRNADSMVHLLLGPTAVTCVVDPNEGSETRAIAARIERSLEGLPQAMIRGPFFDGLEDPSKWIEDVA